MYVIQGSGGSGGARRGAAQPAAARRPGLFQRIARGARNMANRIRGR